MRNILFILAIMVASFTASFAQSATKDEGNFELYTGYEYVNNDRSASRVRRDETGHGFNLGFTKYGKGSNFGVTGEIAAAKGGNNGSNTGRFMGGVQYKLRNAKVFQPSVNAKVGYVGENDKFNPRVNSFGYSVGGALDFRVSDRVSIRPIQYNYVRQSAFRDNAKGLHTFGAGLVFN